MGLDNLGRHVKEEVAGLGHEEGGGPGNDTFHTNPRLADYKVVGKPIVGQEGSTHRPQGQGQLDA